MSVKWPVYIFTFGEINSRQVNAGGIQIIFAQFQTLKLQKEMLNAGNIYLFGIKRTKCKYIDTSFAKRGVGGAANPFSPKGRHI